MTRRGSRATEAAPGPTRGPGGLLRRLRAAVSERLGLKLAALFFTLVLWLVVSAEEPSEVPVGVRWDIRTDSLVTLRREPAVTARVLGRARELLKLYPSPPVIRRTFGPDTPDEVVLRLAPGDVELTGGIEARVRDVSPRVVTLRFDVHTERMVPVRSALALEPADGLTLAGEPTFEPESVQVRGLRAAVRAVEYVPTARLALVVRDTGALTVPLDTTVPGVRVSPGRVRVRVPTAPAPAAAADSARAGGRGRGRAP